MRDLKASQSPREPGVGEGVRGRDREQALVFGAQPRERAVDRVERATDGGGCAAPRVGQRHAAFLAMEQRYAEPFFQQLDLITDRSLRHPEFGGGDRKSVVSGKSGSVRLDLGGRRIIKKKKKKKRQT